MMHLTSNSSSTPWNLVGGYRDGNTTGKNDDGDYGKHSDGVGSTGQGYGNTGHGELVLYNDNEARKRTVEFLFVCL